MKSIILVLAILIGAATTLAQDPNISGVYTGTIDCAGIRSEPVVLRVVHQPDNSLKVTLETGSIGWYTRAYIIGMRGEFRDLTEGITLTSPNLFYPLVINPVRYKKQLMVRFERKCNGFPLERNSGLSKAFISEIKKSKKLDAKTKGVSGRGNFDLSGLQGLWVMSSAQNDEYQIVIEKNVARFQKLNPNGYIVNLEPEMIEAKAGEAPSYIFRPANSQAKDTDFDKVAVTYWATDSSYRSQREHLEVKLLDFGGKWSSATELHRPVSTPGQTRVYEKEVFLYGDWQQRKYDDYFVVDDEEAVKRLKAAINQLYEQDGWRCLAQTSFVITPGQTRRISFQEQGVNRLYLIYSPYGNAGLIYRAIPPELTGLVDTQKYDYPIFVTSHRTLFINSVHFDFHLQPVGSAAVSVPQVPITIFHFGGSMGDYGTGCQYYAAKERADNLRNRVIAKLILVFALEYGRRVSNEAKADIPQLATTAARDAYIRSTLRDVLPEKSDEELDYLTRWTALILSGDFRSESYVRDTIRESIIQRVAKEKPQYKLDARVLDLFIDLALQRRIH